MSTPEERVGIELQLIASVEETEAIVAMTEDEVRVAVERQLAPLRDSGLAGATAAQAATASCFFIFSLGDAVDCIVRTVLNAIVQAISAVIANQFALRDIIGDVGRAIIDSLDGLLGGLLGDIRDAIDDQTGVIIDAINGTFGGIEGALEDVTDAVEGVVGGVLGGVGDLLDGVTEEIEGAIDDALGGVGDQLGEILDGIDGLAGEIIDGIRGEIDGITGTVEAEGEVTREEVRTGVEQTIQGQEALSQQLTDATRTILDGQVQQAERVITEVDSRVRTIVSTEVEPIRAQLTTLEETTSSLSGGVGDIASGIGDMLKASVFGAPFEFGRLITEGLDAAFGGLLERLETDLAGFFRRMLVTFGMPDEIADRFLAAARAGDPGNQVITIGIFTAAIGFALPLVAAQAMAPIVTELVQLINLAVGPSLLTPEQLLTLLTRGDIPRSQFDTQMGQLGFDSANRDRFFRLRRQLLGVRDLSQLWLRGELDEGALRARLAELGVLDREATEVMTLSRPLPGVQDLITMAVREVFTPDVRSRFGLDQDFPPEFERRAAQVGLTPEIARDFWAAHWALPSATQGFQMFQRQIIDQADLELLLRSLDVMPFWRDRLIQLSFRPITRVDIRRIFDLGLIDRPRVVRSFTDLGFSPEDAELQTQFVEAFTQDEPVEERGEAEGLTRAAVLDFMRQGIIDRGQAEAFLLDLGFSASATELFVTATELDIELAERRQEIALTVDQAAAGQITFGEAEDRLSSAQLTPAELQGALAQLRRREAERTTIPSVEQLTAMLGADVIREDDFRDAMARRGFADRWIDAFLELENG